MPLLAKDERRQSERLSSTAARGFLRSAPGTAGLAVQFGENGFKVMADGLWMRALCLLNIEAAGN